MKTKIVIKIIVGLSVIVIIATSIAFSDDDKSSGSQTKNEKDAIKTIEKNGDLTRFDGTTVDLEDYDGKILVINSWASSCPFCVKELPDFGKLQEMYPEDVVVVAVNRAEPERTAREYATQFALEDTIIFALDDDDSYFRSIGGYAMPETVFLDRDGNKIHHKRGAMELDEMINKVKSILNAVE